MINKQNRLFKLVLKATSYEMFERIAIHKSAWMLGPYAQAGYVVTRAWLKEYYRLNGGK